MVEEKELLSWLEKKHRMFNVIFMEITKFKKSDEKQVKELINKLELMTFEARCKKEGRRFNKENFKSKDFKINKKAAAKNIILTARERNEVVGICRILISDDGLERTAEIKRLFVKENYRNSGVGTKLIEETNKILKKEKVEIVMVATPIDEAKEFYEQQGFILDKGYWLFWKPK